MATNSQTMSGHSKSLTQEQRGLLNEYWDSGLTSYRTSENKLKIVELVKKTNLSAKQIKSWIDNNKAKVTRKRFGQPFKKSLKPKKKSAYGCFMSEFISEQECSAGMNTSAVLKEANNAWKNLKATPSVEKYQSMAEKANNSTPASLLPHQKDVMKKKVVEEIQKLCKMLTSFGSEAYFVSCDAEGSIFTAGTTVGQQFLEREKDVVRRFGYQVVGTGYHEKPKKNSRERLVQQVQELFNEKYCVATGKKKFSYKQLALGHIKLIGMPEGLCCKRPTAYGAKDLERLLENRNSLSVVVVDEYNENREQTAAEEDNAAEIPVDGVAFTDQAGCTTEVDDENTNSAPVTEEIIHTEVEGETADTHPVRETELSEIFHDMYSSLTKIPDTAKTSDKEEVPPEFYPIEKILRKRQRKGVLEYRVKWHGYSNKYNQWVAETSISRDVLQNHKQLKQKKRLQKGIKKGHSKK